MSWAAQAAKSQQRAFPMPQPSYGFAAQGLHVAADAGDGSGASASSGSSGVSAVTGSSDDGECLPSGDSEGVIPRRASNAPWAPPWPLPPWAPPGAAHAPAHPVRGLGLSPGLGRGVGSQAAAASDQLGPELGPGHTHTQHPLCLEQLRTGDPARHGALSPLPQWAQQAPVSARGPPQLRGFNFEQPGFGSWSAGPGAAASCCTGVHPAAPWRRHLATARRARSAVSDADDTDGDGGAEAAKPPRPSRPGHSAPAPHAQRATPGADADGDADAGAGGGGGAGRLSAAEYRSRHGIRVDDPDCPEPFQEFRDAPFPPAVMDVLRSASYGAPSAIQAQAWPIALGGRDLVAIASTGSGKTLGYLLPALVHILARGGDPARGPSALVLAPTRELAVQIEREAQRFHRVGGGGGDERRGGGGRATMGRHHGGGSSSALRTLCLYGGQNRREQERGLMGRPHLVIATPGRLLDFLEGGQVSLQQVSYVVLDEADRMLDMGFEPQISAIAARLPPSRQTLLFSATWPREVREVAARFAATEPTHVFIGEVQDKPVAARSITQRVQLVEGADKMAALEAYLRAKLLGQEEREGQAGEDDDERGPSGGRGGGVAGRRAIVFCRTKTGCDLLAQRINDAMPFQAASLHGDKSQAGRDFALAAFRSGRVPVLVATDVAARGLDIPAITAVVNYDMPAHIDDYVHRIGRTGRAGRLGDSLALVTRADAGVARGLVGVLETAGQEVPPELRRLAASSRGGGGDGGRSWGGRGHGGGGGWGGRDRDRDGGAKRHHADDWRSSFGGDGGGGGGKRAQGGRRGH